MIIVGSLLLFIGMMVPGVLTGTTYVDITESRCDPSDGYYLKKRDDIISIYAYPQYNGPNTRDHCDVTVRADEGRKIDYIVENVIFSECGVEIWMFDNPVIDDNPIKIVTCTDKSKVPIQGKTSYNVFRLRVRKTTPESRAFTFSMRLKNDLKDEPLSSTALGVIIAAVLLLLVLLVLASTLLFKYFRQTAHKHRQELEDEVFTRAINIYNSKDLLEEPDCVHMKPGETNCRNKGRRKGPEIAFVHSDGRLERFRLLVDPSSKREESLQPKKQTSTSSRPQLHSHGPRHHQHVEDMAYVNFSPVCAKPEPVPALCLGADHMDIVSLRSDTMPPSYEDALTMPAVTTSDSLLKSSRNLDAPSKIEQGYCVIDIGRQTADK